jgi:hypothetical protein
MGLLGLELSDAGILVAGSEPCKLLEIDGQEVESPGYALPGKKQLAVGKAAEIKAHLYPRQVLNRFWDQLNTEPLEQSNPYAQNHAEIAYAHLAHIWESIKQHGNEIVIAVPNFYTRDHLGLILGIARELSIQVKGFVASAVSAFPNQLTEGLLLHLDIHLHRFEIACLEHEQRLVQKDSVSIEGTGLIKLYKDWVNAIAEEFVRSTRFDPFHQAASEQELYDRLPVVLSQLRQKPSIIFEMTGGSKTYHVTLTQESFLNKSEPVFKEIIRLVDRMRKQHGQEDSPVTIELTHRLARLPGINETISRINGALVVELEPGAAALESLRYWSQIADQRADRGAPFLTSRPLPTAKPAQRDDPQPHPEGDLNPTHVLYRNLAYPITAKPLFIGLGHIAARSGIQIQGQIAGVSRKHCSIQLHGNEIVLTDYSTYGTFVNEKKVAKRMMLQLGQVIRVGTPGEELKLIACVDSHET